MDPLPPINKVYSLLIQEERHCSVGNNSSPHVESSTPVTKLSSSSGNKNNKNSKGKEKLTCNHCGMNGDTVEKNSSSTSTSLAFTQEQCQLFLAMLGTNSTSMAEFAANNSGVGNPTISEERIPSLVEYSFTPSAKLESASSILNGINPIPANNSVTDANGSLSISLLFPPAMSEIETDDSCSESDETRFSYSIQSYFRPGRSETDSNSKIYEIIPTDPSSTASPRHTATFKERPESSNNSKYNQTPPKFSHSKKKSILSLFFTAMSLTNRSKRPRHTILARRFKDLKIIHRERFPLRMLREATNNFSEDCKIETDHFGSMYHATLDDG
ncbi:uncharacterized protein LOC142617782 [Castanea sativa]|uniref:uncharacterized protein LOC142617782 n=1 Tax=Castanea sativa TaxID=21020 RepID=UPI003F64A8A1